MINVCYFYKTKNTLEDLEHIFVIQGTHFNFQGTQYLAPEYYHTSDISYYVNIKIIIKYPLRFDKNSKQNSINRGDLKRF